MIAVMKNLLRTFSAFYGSNRSTIYALATGGIRSALAVVRVSGPNSREVLNTLGKFGLKNFPEPRKAILRKLYEPLSSSLLDHGIVLWFPGPRSYTGEDCCEFHIHGGPAVVRGLLQSIQSVPGCRMAEPGEFTKRAFLSGKMDLTEVDGLADLIAAETEMQRIQALKQMSGSLSRIYEDWRNKIAKCLATAEAYIDFGEDDNIESDVMEGVGEEVKSLIQNIQNHLKDERRGQRLRNGLRIAILGKPNVGKSTLLNLLCRREAAIVSNVPGTTRDVVEGCVNILGFPIIFADTAGIRSLTTDHIEAEGIRRSLGEAEMADFIILLIDALQFLSTYPSISSKKELLQNELSGFSMAQKERTNWDEVENKTLVVLSKLDLVDPERLKLAHETFDSAISCKTTKGIENFHQVLSKSVSDLCGDPKKDSPCVTQERYRSELESCVKSLLDFQEHSSSDLALRTNHLKNAINSIGAITGHFGTEDILDIIFRDFCIGK